MTTKNNARISVRNFGPIAEAKDVELCPLTVFVGPSNTGKSYLAILIYALLNSFGVGRHYHPFARRALLGRRITRRDRRRALEMGEEDVRAIRGLFNGDNVNVKFSDFPQKMQVWANEVVDDIVHRNFHEALPRCMGASSGDNESVTEGFTLSFEDSVMAFNLSHVGGAHDLKMKENSTIYGKMLRRYLAIQEDRPQGDVEMMKELLSNGLLESIFLSGRTEYFYLPAARTGIMQSHRVIAAALVGRAASAGLEPVSVPTLSGIVTDFLQEIIVMGPRRRAQPDIAQVADDIEEKILHGAINLSNSEDTQYPEFSYRQNGLEIPLLRSSSMVSELAPIVLFIRHRVGKGDLLIIEEPEAHLHPGAQRNIARMLVRLVRAGVRVIVTTHSDYFLEQLANHVRSSKLDKPRDVSLEERDIGAYSFTMHKKGTVVKRLQFDNVNGLSPDDHDKVSSDLYNETAGILDRIEGNR